MVMTFDFINYAQRNDSFMNQLNACLASQNNAELCTDICRLIFDGAKRLVRIEPISNTSAFHHKIIPALMKYDNLTDVLNGNWEALEGGVEWL